MPRYNQDPRYSTFYKKKADIKTFQPLVPVEQPSGKTDYFVDALNHKFLKRINNIQNFTLFKHDGVTHITTIAFQVYGSTGYWWAIMLYNGFMHPLEIEAGYFLKIPNQQELELQLQETKKEYSPGSRTVEI